MSVIYLKLTPRCEQRELFPEKYHTAVQHLKRRFGEYKPTDAHIRVVSVEPKVRDCFISFPGDGNAALTFAQSKTKYFADVTLVTPDNVLSFIQPPTVLDARVPLEYVPDLAFIAGTDLNLFRVLIASAHKPFLESVEAGKALLATPPPAPYSGGFTAYLSSGPVPPPPIAVGAPEPPAVESGLLVVLDVPPAVLSLLELGGPTFDVNVGRLLPPPLLPPIPTTTAQLTALAASTPKHASTKPPTTASPYAVACAAISATVAAVVPSPMAFSEVPLTRAILRGWTESAVAVAAHPTIRPNLVSRGTPAVMPFGCSPLLAAVVRKDLAVLGKLLTSRSASPLAIGAYEAPPGMTLPPTVTRYGVYPLLAAAAVGDVEVARQLLQHPGCASQSGVHRFVAAWAHAQAAVGSAGVIQQAEAARSVRDLFASAAGSAIEVQPAAGRFVRLGKGAQNSQPTEEQTATAIADAQRTLPVWARDAAHVMAAVFIGSATVAAARSGFARPQYPTTAADHDDVRAASGGPAAVVNPKHRQNRVVKHPRLGSRLAYSASAATIRVLRFLPRIPLGRTRGLWRHAFYSPPSPSPTLLVVLPVPQAALLTWFSDPIAPTVVAGVAQHLRVAPSAIEPLAAHLCAPPTSFSTTEPPPPTDANPAILAATTHRRRATASGRELPPWVYEDDTGDDFCTLEGPLSADRGDGSFHTGTAAFAVTFTHEGDASAAAAAFAAAGPSCGVVAAIPFTTTPAALPFNFPSQSPHPFLPTAAGAAARVATAGGGAMTAAQLVTAAKAVAAAGATRVPVDLFLPDIREKYRGLAVPSVDLPSDIRGAVALTVKGGGVSTSAEPFVTEGRVLDVAPVRVDALALKEGEMELCVLNVPLTVTEAAFEGVIASLIGPHPAPPLARAKDGSVEVSGALLPRVRVVCDQQTGLSTGCVFVLVTSFPSVQKLSSYLDDRLPSQLFEGVRDEAAALKVGIIGLDNRFYGLPDLLRSGQHAPGQEWAGMRLRYDVRDRTAVFLPDMMSPNPAFIEAGYVCNYYSRFEYRLPFLDSLAEFTTLAKTAAASVRLAEVVAGAASGRPAAAGGVMCFSCGEPGHTQDACPRAQQGGGGGRGGGDRHGGGRGRGFGGGGDDRGGGARRDDGADEEVPLCTNWLENSCRFQTTCYKLHIDRTEYEKLVQRGQGKKYRQLMSWPDIRGDKKPRAMKGRGGGGGRARRPCVYYAQGPSCPYPHEDPVQ